jgi:probable HAF family extracellular repeat protein
VQRFSPKQQSGVNMNSLSLSPRRSSVLPVSFLTIALLPLGAAAQTFEITDLGTLGGAESSANAIAGNNTIVGWALSGSGQRAPFSLADGGSMENLGYLPYGTDGAATSISRNGALIAGFSGISFNFNEGTSLDPVTGTEVRQGFLLRNGEMVQLGALYDPAFVSRRHGFSEAHGVNNNGQVVGYSVILRASSEHAFVWQNGLMVDIGGGEGNASLSRAFGINDGGEIVGDMAEATEPPLVRHFRRAVRWLGTTPQFLSQLPGHNSSSARAINANGQIVGWSGVASTPDNLDAISWSHAALWDAGSVQDLGTLSGDESSQAIALNDHGQIVGWSGTVNQASSAFLYQCGEMLDLNALIPAAAGWQLIEARGINNAGRIVGLGSLGGQLRGFVLQPNQAPGECGSTAPETPPVERPGNPPVTPPVTPPETTPPAEPPPVTPPVTPPETPPANPPVEPPGTPPAIPPVAPPVNPPEPPAVVPPPAGGNTTDPDGWPGIFSGVTPPPGRALGVNNIGVYDDSVQRVYSCVNMQRGGRPEIVMGQTRLEVAFDIQSIEQGIVRVAQTRQFNPSNARLATGEVPACSGSFDVATSIYEDIIQVGTEPMRARFVLVDGEALDLRLQSLELAR